MAREWPEIRAAGNSMRLRLTRVQTALLFLGASVVSVAAVYILGSPRGANLAVSADYFSPSYAAARSRFRDKVKAARGRLESLELDARGPDGETLSIDIGWFGAEQPQRVLLLSSGLHGSEGFAGSAIQLQFLEAVPQVPDDGTIVIVHTLNPYGMAWLRRVNEENVDLNRNFLGPDESYAGAPQKYSELDPFLNPPNPPSWDLFYAKALWLLLWDRDGTIKQAVTGGQYEYHKGLFFGGKRLQEGPQRIQSWVEQHLATAKHIVVIDIHTGLGKYGNYKLHADAKDYERLRSIFGARVIKLDPKGNVYAIRGGFRTMFPRAVPGASVDFVSQEFGTYNQLRVLQALRQENRWHHYGKDGINHRAKATLTDVFCPEYGDWRRSVLAQGKEVLQTATQFAFSPTR